MLESFFNKVAGLQPVSFLKRLPSQVISCEVCETFKNTYFKNICKRLLLEVFYKKAVPKNLAIFTGKKLVSDKCSVKKMFLVVDGAVKVTCSYIDQHLL